MYGRYASESGGRDETLAHWNWKSKSGTRNDFEKENEDVNEFEVGGARSNGKNENVFEMCARREENEDEAREADACGELC